MRTMKEKPATPQQVKALHATFRRMGYEDGERHAFISRFTEGRTDSTAGLTMGEARRLLGALNERDTEAAREEARRVCRQIYSLSFRISCLNKGFAADTPEDFEMNKAKISLFCRTRTRFRKPLTMMTLAELREVKRQLEAMARKENQH